MSLDLTGVFDAIVIGAGHNGLVAAAYLARAGLRVAVLERRDIVGGAAVTEVLVPGFRFSRAAYVQSLFRPRIIQDLALASHGFEMIPRSPSSFTPLLDGRHLFLGPDSAQNQREVAKFSARDAQALPHYEALMEKTARFLEPLLDRPPPDLDSPGFLARFASFRHLAGLGLSALSLGKDIPRVLEILTAPAKSILERWFESEPLRGTLATDAIIGAMGSPSTPGSAYVLLHHVMGETNGVRGVWGYVRGGMGSLSRAIARAAEAAGARILTERPVTRILVEGGRAAGVVLANGSEVRAPLVLSNADPKVTFLDLLPASSLPEEFHSRISTLDFSSGVTKINAALDRLPSFTALPGSAAGPQHRGTVHIVSTMDEIEKAYLDAAAGRSSARPVIEMTLPSSLDSTLAPAGKHVVSLFVQYTPYRLAEGKWDDAGRKDAFADLVFRVIEEYAPGFTSSVIARDVLSPLDLERIYGLTGGNIFHGAMGLDQLFWLRPAAGYARYRTPIPGLYLAGAGAHPGGGVLGAAGRNAALAALADLRKKGADGGDSFRASRRVARPPSQQRG